MIAAKNNHSRIVALLAGRRGLQRFRGGELVEPFLAEDTEFGEYM